MAELTTRCRAVGYAALLGILGLGLLVAPLAAQENSAPATPPAAAAKTEPAAPADSAKPDASPAAPASTSPEPAPVEPAQPAAPASPPETSASEQSVIGPAQTPPAKSKAVSEEDVTRTVLLNLGTFLALLIGSAIVGQAIASRVGLPDQGLRWQVIVFAVSAALVVSTSRWPPKLGIDLSGGSILNYAINRAATTTDTIDMDKLVNAIMRRVNPGGVREVTVRPYGGNEIEIIIPKASEEEIERIKKMISSSGALEFRVTANPHDHPAIVAQAQITTGDRVFTKTADGQDKLVARWVVASQDEEASLRADSQLIKRENARGQLQILVAMDDLNVTGDYLTHAGAGNDYRSGAPCVEFSFNAAGAARFQRLTSTNKADQNVNRRLAILLDDFFITSPSIQAEISDRGQITGNFTVERVNEQVAILTAGSLPAALYKEPTSEMFIGPTLGADTIQKGVQSMAVGTLAVIVFMLVYYRFAGIVANLAVVLNVLMTVSFMMMFHAAFTLSGLAGLALTVGMAVDANVLIYERIREELSRGATLRMAIRNGFDRASTTIIDANVTTLIAGIVLMAIGTDQVKGFAVTLIIGLLTNLFTAITFSRAVFEAAERTRLIRSLSFMQVIGSTNFDFVGKRKIAAVASIVAIIIGLAACFDRKQGLLDIDFTGGTSVQVLFDKSKPPVDIATVRERVKGMADVSVQDVTFADEQRGYRFLIVTSEANSETDADGRVIKDHLVENKIHELFTGELAWNEMKIVRSEPIPGAPPAAAQPDAKSGAGLFPPDLLRAQASADERLLAQAPASDATPAAPTESAKSAEPAKSTEPTAPAASTPAVAGSIDRFAGGTLAELSFSEKIGQATLQRIVEEQLAALGKELVPFELTNPFAEEGASNAFDTWTLRVALPEAEARGLLEQVQKLLRDEPFFPASSKVGAAVAAHTQNTALAAIGLSLLLILAYVWFRFSQFIFGISSVVAVIHDVLIALGALALSHHLATPLGFLGVESFKINLPIIAAFLTLIGFSLNDTIVIFDRIRELRGKSTELTPELVNLSINQTLSRTILTSLTVFITVLILYTMGGQGLHGFAYTLVIGVVAGTYSTVFVATPLVIWLHKIVQARAESTPTAGLRGAAKGVS